MFTFWVPTMTMFGAGKLNELHTQINTPTGVIQGKKPSSSSPMVLPPVNTVIWHEWKTSCSRRLWIM